MNDNYPTLEEVKSEIINRAKATGYKNLTKSLIIYYQSINNKEDLISYIRKDFNEHRLGEIITAEFLEENFPQNLLHKYKIYTSGNHEVINSSDIIVLGKCSVFVYPQYGCSKVQLFDESNLKMRTISNTAIVRTYDKSTAFIELLGESAVIIEAFDNSKITAQLWSNSSLTTRTWPIEKLGLNPTISYSFEKGDCITVKDLDLKKIILKTLDFEVINNN